MPQIEIFGTVAGQGSASAGLNHRVAIAGTAAGVGSLPSDLSGTLTLIGAAAGSSRLNAQPPLRVFKGVSGIPGEIFYVNAQGVLVPIDVSSLRDGWILVWNETQKKWVASGAGGSSGFNIINAKGDLIVGLSDDTPDILPVGSDGRVLVADSSASLGVRWGVVSGSGGGLGGDLPINADYSWVNQGPATISDDGDSGLLISFETGGAAAPACNCRVKAAPARPYTITARVKILYESTNAAGILWRESSSGRLATLGVGFTGHQISSSNWTNPTSFSAHIVQKTLASLNNGLMLGGDIWLRITEDNTNRITQWSFDGIKWRTLTTVGRTTTMTADQVGFFVESGSTTTMVSMRLWTWTQT